MLLRITHNNNPEEYTILTKDLRTKEKFCNCLKDGFRIYRLCITCSKLRFRGCTFSEIQFCLFCCFFFAKFSGSQESQVKKNSVVKGTHLQP